MSIEQLIPGKALLENIFLQSSNVIAITNADVDNLKFEYVNPAFLEMTGYSLTEVIGKSPKMLQGPKTKRDMTRKLKESCKKGEPFRGDNINYKKDGSVYAVGWTVTPIKDDLGKIINFLSIQKDITKLKELEEENIKNQKLAALRQISSGLTHELNTALTRSKGNLDILEYDMEDVDDESVKGFISNDVQNIKKGIDYISFLTNSLHYLTNTEFNKDETVNVFEILLESLKNCERLDRVTSWKLNGKSVFESVKRENLSVKADRKSLNHLFMIILDNALDELSKKDKRENTLDIEIKKDKDIVIKITDNAGGIPKECIDKLFDPLYRNKEFGGLGIGLFVAKNIIGAHKGTLEVYSDIPYTTFEIIL